MATVQQGLQAQIRNIEATYGKPMSEWIDIISASGLTKHADVVNMLKKDYGMTHGAARAAEHSDGYLESSLSTPSLPGRLRRRHVAAQRS